MAFGLADEVEEFVKPFGIDGEGFTALDAVEFDGAEDAVLVFIVPDDTPDAAQGGIDGQVDAGLDETDILDIGGGGAAEVAAFLDKYLFCADHFRELLGEILTWVNGIKFDVAKGIAWDLLAFGLHHGDDIGDAGALGDEDVHVVNFVHDGFEASGFGLDIDGHFRDVDAMDFKAFAAEAEFGQIFLVVNEFGIFVSGGSGEPAAVAAHDLVDDEHARIGVVLIDDIFKKQSALFGGGPCAEALADGVDIIVDGFGQADDSEVVLVFLEEGGEVSGGGIGVVAAYGVEDIDAILDQLISSDLLRILAFFDKTALDAVLDVGEFDAAVADGGAAELMENRGIGADDIGYRDRVAEQQAFVAAAVADDFDGGIDLGIAFNEAGDGAVEAGGQASGGKNGNFFWFHISG